VFSPLTSSLREILSDGLMQRKKLEFGLLQRSEGNYTLYFVWHIKYVGFNIFRADYIKIKLKISR
jgi:hypothetical protein